MLINPKPHKIGIPASATDTVTVNPLLITGHSPAPLAESELLPAATTFAAYSVVGRITATGVLKFSDLAAVDGSQVPCGFTATEAVTGAGIVDQRVAVLKQGVFNPDLLVWHASYNTDFKKLNAFKTGAPGLFLKAPAAGN